MAEPPDRSSLLDDLLALEDEASVLALIRQRRAEVDDVFLIDVGSYGQSYLIRGNVDQADQWFTLGETIASTVGNDVFAGRFRMQRGIIARRWGDIDLARKLWIEAAENTSTASFTDEGALATWVGASQQLADIESEAGRAEEAKRLVNTARLRCHDRSFHEGEAATSLQLLRMALESKDLDAARQYAGFVEALVTDQSLMDPAAREQWSRAAAPLFGDVAIRLYYDEDDWKGAAHFASIASRFLPGEQGPVYVLGIAQLRLEQFEEAVATWQKAIEIDPNKPAHHTNYAQALLATDRTDVAIDELKKSLDLDPEQPRVWHSLGEVLHGAERHQDAIETFTRLLALLEPRLTGPPAQPVSHRSRAEYERNMPLQDLADFARLMRVKSHQALGHIDDAVRDLDFLIEHGDQVTRDTALTLKQEIVGGSDVESDDDRSNRADTVLARTRRAKQRLKQGHFDEVYADLEYIAHKSREPETAIDLLTELLAADPTNVPARGLRGYAYWQALQPTLAEEDLNVAISAFPEDSRFRLWRGLARISASVRPEDKERNDSLSTERVFGALADLARAARRSKNAPEPLRAFKWLLDHFASDWEAIAMLVGEGHEKDGIFQVLPELEPVLDRFFRTSNMLSYKQEWRQAVDELHPVHQALQELGLPGMAQSVHLLLADNYLRLDEIQRARYHLAEARKLPIVQARPLSADVEHMAAERAAQAEGSFNKIANIEIDYLPAYGLGSRFYELYLDIIEAQLQVRLGDPAAAVDKLADIDKYLDDIHTSMKLGLSFQLLLGVVKVLRDTRQFERAIDLLQKLRPAANDARDVIAIESTEGGLWEALGDREMARRSFLALQQRADEAGIDLGAVPTMQIAANHWNAGQLEEGLQVLLGLDIESRARSDRDRLMYYTLGARFYDGLDDLAAAKAMALKAIVLAEKTRGALRQYDARVSWQADKEWLYQVAILGSMLESKAEDAFDLVQRCKARTFSEQIANAELPLPPEGQRALEALRRKTAIGTMLAQLADGLRTETESAFFDVELVRALEKLEPGENVLVEEEGRSPRLSASKVRDRLRATNYVIEELQDQVEEMRLAAVDAASERVTSLRDVRAMLQPHVVLAEYFVTRRAILLFVVRGDVETPAVETIGIEQDGLADVTVAYLTDLLNDVEQPRADSATTLDQLVAPLGRHTQEGDVIWFVAHQMLHYLPLHALRIDGHFLIDRNPVCYSPSVAVMKHRYDHAPTVRIADAVVVGDSRGDLLHARVEAEAVSTLLGAAPLLGQAATKEALLGRLQQHAQGLGVLHVACHGYFDGSESLKSGIVLARPPDADPSNADDRQWDLLAHEILGMSIPAAMVSLSACETGMTEVRSGDEPFGLVRAILLAGARAAVVSLWPVADLSTSLFFRKFYELLGRPRTTKAQALRRAQRYVRGLTARQIIEHIDGLLAIRFGDDNTRAALYAQRAGLAAAGDDACPFNRPSHWAPFLLIGDWR